MGLTHDVSLTRFSLGIERVEGEVEVMFGRFARVDGAAPRHRSRRLHGGPSMPCDVRPLDRMELRLEVCDGSLTTGTGSTLPLRRSSRAVRRNEARSRTCR